MHRRYGANVEFLAVYIREAHATDGWRSEANDKLGLNILQPLNIDQRRNVAQQCSRALKIQMPVVVDELDDRVGRAYNAMPDRLFLIDKQGRVAYRGGPGPFGYNPAELEQSLVMSLLEDAPAKTIGGASGSASKKN
jgi:Iodothyronine deiodinase